MAKRSELTVNDFDVNGQVNYEPESATQEGQLQQWISAAEDASMGADWNTAREYIKRVLVHSPGHSQATFLAARIEASAGDLDTAIEMLQGIDEHDPQFGIASRGQSAQWLAERGRVAEAKQAYQRALELAPDSLLIRRQYARYLNFLGWRYQARDVLGPLIQSHQANEEELRAILDVSNSFADSQATVEKNKTVLESPVSEALGWLARRQPREANELLEAFIQAGFVAHDDELHAILAATKAELQEFDDVVTLLKSLPPEKQTSPMYWRAVGDFASFRGQVESAVAAYHQALTLDTTSDIAHERLTAALLANGQPVAARAVDERRAALIHVKNASTRLLSSGNIDEDALKAFVENIGSIGLLEIGSAWLAWLSAQRPADPAFKAMVAVTLQRWQSVPEDIVLHRQTAGMGAAPAVTETIQLMLGGLSVDVLQEPANEDASPLSPAEAATFLNVASERGLRHRYLNSAKPRTKNFQIYQSIGAGAAALDYDLDGNVDLYLGQGGGEPPHGLSEHSNELFRNLGGQFLNRTVQASVIDRNFTLGVSAGDINDDGFPDLVIGNLGNNRMLVNNGDGTFEDVSDRIGWSDPSLQHFTTSMAIADISGDGLSDVIEINYVNSPSMYESLPVGPDGNLVQIPGPLFYRAEVDRVWIASGGAGLAFEPKTLGNPEDDWGKNASAAIGDAANPGLGVIVSNLDQDPDLEIFVANDMRPNQLWKRDRSITDSVSFSDLAVIRGCALSSRGEATACMGVAWGDFDRNQLPDLFVTNYQDEWVNLYLMQPGGHFRDSAPRYGLDRLSENVLGFGAQAVDFDHDGLIDLGVFNGHVDAVSGSDAALAMPAQLLHNLNGRFELAKHTDGQFWDAKHLGRCAITVDYNLDGKMDLLVVDLLEDVALLENRTITTNHWLQLETKGVESSRDAIGAHVAVTQGSKTLHHWTSTGDGYQGKNESVAEFGLGTDATSVDVLIEWPSGRRSNLTELQPDRRYLIVENEDSAWQQVVTVRP